MKHPFQQRQQEKKGDQPGYARNRRNMGRPGVTGRLGQLGPHKRGGTDAEEE